MIAEQAKSSDRVAYKKLLRDYLTIEELKEKINEWTSLKDNTSCWGESRSCDDVVDYFKNYIINYDKDDYFSSLDYIREAIIHKSLGNDYKDFYCNGDKFKYFAIWDQLPTIAGLELTNIWFSSKWGYDQTNVDIVWLLNKKLWGLNVLAEEEKGKYLLKRIKNNTRRYSNPFNDEYRRFNLGVGDPQEQRNYDASVTGLYR